MILLRYPQYLHPVLRGTVPLIVAGPSLPTKFGPLRGLWRLSRSFEAEFRHAIGVLNGEERPAARRIIAEMLLAERLVQALWVTATPSDPDDPLPLEQRWDASIDQLASEVPTDLCGAHDHAADFLEFLDGLCAPSYYPSMFAQHDDIELQPQLIVV